MPWASDAQRAWGNSATGRKELGAAKVAEYNEASKGKKLPRHVPAKKKKKARKRGG